jgi:hypothetical protein
MKKYILNYVILLLLLSINSFTANAQNLASRKQWQYNKNNSDQLGLDRINKVIEETTGKNIFCVGRSERLCNGNLVSLPTAVKLDAAGKQLTAEFYPVGDCSMPGQVDDIIEEDANNLIIAGTKLNPATTRPALLLMRIRKSNLQVLTSVMITEAMLQDFTSIQPNQYLRGPVSIQMVNNGSLHDGFIISLSADEPTASCAPNSDDLCTFRGAVLIRLDANFGFINSFGSHAGGWEIYQSDANGSNNYLAQSENVAVIYNSNGTPNGFVITGSQLETPGTFNNRDVLLIRTGSDGATQWINTYSEISLGISYTDNLPDDLVCTDGSVTTNETNDERGKSVIYDQVNNQLLLLAEFDYLRLHGTAITCSSFSPIQNYLDCDAALIKLGMNGSIIWAKNISHYTGFDFNASFFKTDNNYYVGGNSIESGYILYRLHKLDLSGNPVWDRDYKGIDAGHHYSGMMSIAACKDEGVLMAGFNHSTLAEDFFVLKLRSDCQMLLASDPNNWDVDGAVISSPVTWNTDMKVKGWVKIVNGGVLRIENSAVIQFANTTEINDFDYLASNNFINQTFGNTEPTRITVEPGGQLIIEEGAVLKGLEACLGEFMWEGIELLGEPSLPQAPLSNQGFCAIRNSSTIMNAVIGVAVGKTEYNERGRIQITVNDGGGVLQVAPVIWPLNQRSGIFIDCRNSVQFAPYEFNPTRPSNRSMFHLAEFNNYQKMVDPEYMDSGIESFVTLERVHTLRFYGTKFRKDYAVNNAIETGIKSIDANFWVDRSFMVVDQYGNNMGQQSSFYGLFYGIKADNVISTVSFMVKGSYFDLNYVGVYANNVNYMQILRNEFVIQFLNSWGILVSECTGYRIEENVFNGGAQLVGGNQAGSGVVFVRYFPNEDLDIIYKNQFYGLNHGVRSFGYLNGNTTAGQGLKIVCNHYSGNIRDNQIEWWPLPCASICPGVSVSQGSLSEPSRNTFDPFCNFFSEKFLNAVPNLVVDYYFNMPLDPTDPQFCRYRIDPIASGNIFEEDDCPSRIDISGYPDRLAISQNADTALVLESLIDGGNTEALLTLIETGSAQQILNALLQFSPYLSNAVLIKMMEEAGLNASQLADIILLHSADPSVPQPEPDPETNEITALANEEEVISSIEVLPISPMLKNILLEAQKGRSAKQALLTEIGRYKANSRFALNNCIQYFLADTVCESAHDSLMDLLRYHPSFLYIRTMIERHFLAKQFDSAWVKLNTLNGIPEYENYVSLMSYLIDIGQNGYYVEYLRQDESGKELIESIAADSSKYGYEAARAILSHVFGYQYPVELPESESQSSPRMLKPSKTKDTYSGPKQIIIQPNPFNLQTEIKIINNGFSVSSVFKITDMHGKEIKQYELKQGDNSFTLHSAGLKPGVYAGQLFQDGVLTASIKLIHVR